MVWQRLSKVLDASLVILFIGLIGVTALQVLNRFFQLKWVLSGGWTQEVIGILFAWIIVLGAAIGIREKTHLALDMISSFLSAALKKVFEVFLDLIILYTAVLFFISSGKLCLGSVGNSLSALPDVPENVLYGGAVLSGFLMIVFIVQRIWIRLTAGSEFQRGGRIDDRE